MITTGTGLEWKILVNRVSDSRRRRSALFRSVTSSAADSITGTPSSSITSPDSSTSAVSPELFRQRASRLRTAPFASSWSRIRRRASASIHSPSSTKLRPRIASRA